LTPREIKQEIKNWRADNHRMWFSPEVGKVSKVRKTERRKRSSPEVGKVRKTERK
jgi:hypothetical protein